MNQPHRAPAPPTRAAERREIRDGELAPPAPPAAQAAQADQASEAQSPGVDPANQGDN